MADTSEKDSIYFAGFFDGEGCVAIYPKKYVVSLTNTDIRPLVEAKNLWGGFISCQKASTRSGAVQDLWRWQIYGHSARQFLMDIRPFSIIKSEQIDIYLDALSYVPLARGSKYKGNAKEEIVVRASNLRVLKRGAG